MAVRKHIFIRLLLSALFAVLYYLLIDYVWRSLGFAPNSVFILALSIAVIAASLLLGIWTANRLVDRVQYDG